MSGTIGPSLVSIQGASFFNNTPTVAAALDLQSAVAAATSLLTAELPTLQAAQAQAIAATAAVNAAVTSAAQAIAVMLAQPLGALPTTPADLPVGAAWNNGGVLSIVTSS